MSTLGGWWMTKVMGLAAIGMLTLLGGCAFDHFNRLDRVTLAGGDAVKANLEMQTIDPTKESQYRTRGLGRNGVVIPGEEGDTVPAPVPGS
jgi:hypothetical protein